MTTITHAEFVRNIIAADLFLKYSQSAEQVDYAYAYCYGLRRCYHGKQYGLDEKVAKIIKKSGPSRMGFEDGLAGEPYDFQRFQKEDNKPRT